MGFATLPEFTLHLDQRRLEMREVKVLRTGRCLHLIGTVKKETEAIASPETSNIVFKTEMKREREAMIKLLANRRGEILAFESDNLIGLVIWDDNTNARKLPDFMRRLMGVYP